MSSPAVSKTANSTIDKNLKGYLPTLDGWRAIAIMAVLLDHATTREWLQKIQYFRTGPNGVSLFFAISGYLICSRLLEEESARGRISLKDFYIRRACRILPPAFAYLAVVGLLGMIGCIAVTPAEWWSCIFFSRNYLPYHEINYGWGGFTIHYWSLAVEEHFYLLWPALLFLCGRARALYVALALAISVAIWRWWDFHHQVFAKLVPGLLWPSRTDIRLDGLLLGCIAALLLANSENRKWMMHYVNTPIWAGLVVIYALFQIVPGRHLYSIWESAILATVVAWTVIHPHTLIGKILESTPLKWIGRLSYSLYLWQQLFLVGGACKPLAWLQVFPLGIVMTFIVAALSYKYIERPLIRVGHRLAPPQTPGRTDLAETT